MILLQYYFEHNSTSLKIKFTGMSFYSYHKVDFEDKRCWQDPLIHTQ